VELVNIHEKNAGFSGWWGTGSGKVNVCGGRDFVWQKRFREMDSRRGRLEFKITTSKPVVKTP